MTLNSRSLKNLEGVVEQLRQVVLDVMSMNVMDFSVVEGLRTLERQKELVAAGASKTLNSKHLTGHAVDLYPFPVDMKKVKEGNWVECSRFGVLAGLMYAAAQARGVKLRWGLDWDFDGETLDSAFKDAPHFEIVE